MNFEFMDDPGYMDVYEAAKKWDSTPGDISMLCQAGLVREAKHSRVDGRWLIPLDAPYPYNTTDAKLIAIF